MTRPGLGPELGPFREPDDDVAALALDPAFVLPRLVSDWARLDPDRPFLREVTGRALGYGATWTAVRRWATWLGELGVGAGDRVVTLLPSSVDAVLAWLATGLVGALEVPVDPALRGTFLRHVLFDSGARVCLVRPELADLVTGSGVPGLTVVVVDRAGGPADVAAPSRTRPSPDRPPPAA